MPKSTCDGVAKRQCAEAGCPVPRQCIENAIAEASLTQARGAIAAVSWPRLVLAAGCAALLAAVVA